MKVCTKCGVSKSLDAFRVNSIGSQGRTARCKECLNAEQRDRRQAAPEAARSERRAYLLRYHYGITLDDYDRMLQEQDGRCACCGTTQPQGNGGSNFHVDHNHETGQVRGLLCHPCNTGIGSLGDSSEGVRRALEYLVRHEAA